MNINQQTVNNQEEDQLRTSLKQNNSTNQEFYKFLQAGSFSTFTLEQLNTVIDFFKIQDQFINVNKNIYINSQIKKTLLYDTSKLLYECNRINSDIDNNKLMNFYIESEKKQKYTNQQLLEKLKNNKNMDVKQLQAIYIDGEKKQISNDKYLQLLERLRNNESILDLTPLKNQLDNTMIQLLSNDAKRIYPDEDIINLPLKDKILKQKCNVTQKYLSKITYKLLKELASSNSGITNYMSLSKSELCQAIADIQILAEIEATNSMTLLSKKLTTARTLYKSTTFEDTEVKSDIDKKIMIIDERLEKLTKLSNEWKNIQTYINNEYCIKIDKSTKCIDTFKSLHLITVELTTKSKKYKQEIDEIMRKIKIGSLTKKSNMFELFNANFL